MQRHINTKGMGILNIPGEIEKAGGKLSMAVQAEGNGTSPGNWHSEFTVEEWNDFKKALNDSGMTITDVWIDESKNGRSGNMKRAIKSSLDDAFTVHPWSSDCWKYSDQDLGLSYVIEAYGDEFVNLDDNKLKAVKDELVKYFDDDDYVLSYNQNNPDYEIESIHDVVEPEDLELEELARYFDYEALGRDLRLGYNMAWDNEHNCWFSTLDVDESEYEDNVIYLGNSRKPIKSSKKPIKSARYIVTDEYGTVIGEADTYEEAKTLGGTITDTQKEEIQSRRKSIKSGFKEKCVELTNNPDIKVEDYENRKFYRVVGSEEELSKIRQYYNAGSQHKIRDLYDDDFGKDQFFIAYSQVIDSSHKPVKSSFEDDETTDVETIKEEWENEGYDPNVIEQFFDEEEIEDENEITYSQERELHKKFEKYNLNITSSKKLSNSNFSTSIVKAVLSNRMTQEEAVTQIASRNDCNRGYARQILSRWINEKAEKLIKSDAELQDIQKPFNVDGDLNSWAEDYMPGSGKANTKGGELVRAAQRILNEYYKSGNMIGRGFGNETVNPAARYIIEKTDFSGNDEIEDMLNHDVQMDDSEYNSWLKRFESDFTDWLRDKEDLFSTPNDDDIADYIEDSDVEYFLKKFHAEDSFGNQYVFEDKDSEFECTEVILANENSYQEGDTFSESDDLASEVDHTEEYGTFEKDGVSYDWEASGSSDENGNYSSWKIVRATIENQPYEVGDLLNMDDFEKLKFYDENGNEITYDDLMRV